MKKQYKTLLIAAMTVGMVGAQETAPAQSGPGQAAPVEQTGGFRRVSEAPADAAPSAEYRDEFGQVRQRGGGGGEQRPMMQAPARAARPQAAQPQAASGQITIPAGAWVTVRVNQPLSSDRNLAGDGFSATLAQPIIADGVVVARRGQTVAGRVAEAVKAGRVKGTSRLGIEITELSLADGQQVPVRTQLVETSAGASKGRDATAIGTTTGVGAAIGAAAAGGFGAGMGAIAGAGASAIGVLVTRGRATEIYPEEVISFRTLAPLTVSTERAAAAFQPVQQNDYQPAQQLQQRVQRPATVYGPSPYFYGGGYYSPYYWGPSWYGPRVSLYYGRGFYGGGRGFGRR